MVLSSILAVTIATIKTMIAVGTEAVTTITITTTTTIISFTFSKKSINCYGHDHATISN